MVECLHAPHHHFMPLRSMNEDDVDSSDDRELHEALIASATLFAKIENQRAEAQKRLMQVVALYRAHVHPVQADGNCQFRAISFALYGNEEHHADLRGQVVDQMRKMPKDYAQFVYEPYHDYVARMARDGEWGDNVTLQAASDVLDCRMQVLTDVPGSESVMVYPKNLRSTEGLVQQPLRSLRESICLTFLTEHHYDAAIVDRC